MAPFQSYALVNFPDGNSEVLMTLEQPEVGKPLVAENLPDELIVTRVTIREEDIDGKTIRWETWVDPMPASE
jgi:hypothetical protein